MSPTQSLLPNTPTPLSSDQPSPSGRPATGGRRRVVEVVAGIGLVAIWLVLGSLLGVGFAGFVLLGVLLLAAFQANKPGPQRRQLRDRGEPVGRALGAVHRSATAMGPGSCTVHGGGRSSLSWVWPPVLLVLAIWMIVRAHRRLRSRSRAWLLYPVLAMLALASLGGGYETVRGALDANAYPIPGQLIDVGRHSLHLHCTGSGSPTVVLEPGGGEMSSSFGWIAPAVARQTRVCVYDRAGHG